MLWRRTLVDLHEWDKSIARHPPHFPPRHFDIIIFVEHLDASAADDAADAEPLQTADAGQRCEHHIVTNARTAPKMCEHCNYSQSQLIF